MGFEDMFIRYYPIARATALRIVRSDSVADDIAQSVFCKLLVKWEALGGRSLDGWIRVAARNAAIDHVRRQQREANYYDSANARAVTHNSAESDAIANIELSAAATAFQTLRSATRALLHESFIQGRSHAAIALRQDVPLGTVKSRIRAAIRQLRRMITSESVSTTTLSAASQRTKWRTYSVPNVSSRQLR